MELKTHYLETFLIGILQKLLPFLKAVFSNFLNCKVSSKTKKIFFRPKMLYLPLWAGMLKNYCHICNQRPPIYLVAKFRTKNRILNLVLKMPYLGVLGRNFEKPWSYLKSVPSNLPYCKHWCKK